MNEFEARYPEFFNAINEIERINVLESLFHNLSEINLCENGQKLTELLKRKVLERIENLKNE